MAPKEFLPPSTAPLTSVRTVAEILQCLVEPQILRQLVDIKELKVHYFYVFLIELRRPVYFFRPNEAAR